MNPALVERTEQRIIGGIIGIMAERRVSVGEPLVVFYVDGTLFRRGLLPVLTRQLANEGVFSKRVRKEHCNFALRR